METTKVTAIPNGPLMVEGTINMVLPDGKTETKESKCFLCRCGYTDNKPYCNGAHKKNNFAG